MEELKEPEVEVSARSGFLEDSDIMVPGVHAVLDLVCCEILMPKKFNVMRLNPVWFLVGFNLDTGKWELVHDDQALCEEFFGIHMVKSKTVVLKPNLFLS